MRTWVMQESFRLTVAVGCLVGLVELTKVSAVGAEPPVPERIEFNRDVRPILSDNCFFCHGPDAGHRKADLRLDLREEAVKNEVIVPGEVDASSLIERIFRASPRGHQMIFAPKCHPDSPSYSTLSSRAGPR